MPTKTIPNSLQEKYDDERTTLYHLLWKIEDALLNLISGNVQSYSLGNRSLTYQNVAELKALKAETEARIEELEALLSHRAPRNVTVNSFISPSFCVPRHS